ncbi:MAG: hypothetical protein V1739_06970 [Candidatus Omnitrophota bacterium]
MNFDRKICAICESAVINFERNHTKVAVYEIDCPKCGFYQITDQFIESASNIPKEDLLLFSGHLRLNSSPHHPIMITSDYCIKIPNIVLPYKKMSVSEKVNNLLKYIYGSTTKVLGEVKINVNEIHRFYLLAPGDLNTILEYLRERKLIRWGEKEGIYRCLLTIEGWERYEQIKNEITNSDSKQVFVAMSFDENLKNIYDEAIKPAAEECGFDAVRVDSQEHNEKICDRIIGEINKSRFVIADFTQNKHGVYFETGYALGLKIPVIWTCSENEIDGLHFDTRQYNHISWKDFEDLKEKLINRINATIKMNERVDR